MHSTTRLLGSGWTFTRICRGQGPEDGQCQWLKTTAFPTLVHVELLHSKIIPDPVSTASYIIFQRDGMRPFFLIVRWALRVGCTVYV